MSILTQETAILQALKAGETITPLDALNRWGCFRLGARIHDLRRKGYDIKTARQKGLLGQRYAAYSLNQ